jgi:RNA polymerase subunit RPABC4/transcription elongation factor Spt4
MKQCVICLADAEATAETCPLCGEASWSEATAEVVTDELDVTTGDASPQAKRVKRK